MKILVTPGYYAENREELDKLVKNTDDIIILNNASNLTPNYMLVSNKQVEEYYHHYSLVDNLNKKFPIDIIHREDGSVSYIQKRFIIPPVDWEVKENSNEEND